MAYPTLWRGTRGSVLRNGSELDRLFDSFFSVPFTRAGAVAAWTPAVDVKETEDAVLLSTELPGLTSKDVKVTVEDGVLSISGEKKQEVNEGGENGDHWFTERRYGSFERSFTLPRGVNAAKVAAKFENGVLTVELPKAAEAKAREIVIS